MAKEQWESTSASFEESDELSVRRSVDADGTWNESTLIESWGSVVIANRSGSCRADQLSALLAERCATHCGPLTYVVKGSVFGVVTIDALRVGKGVAAALLERARELARYLQCQ